MRAIPCATIGLSAAPRRRHFVFKMTSYLKWTDNMYRYWSSLTWALHSIWSITWYFFGVLRISLYFVELHWSSYLSGRFQQVVIDGATSDKFDIDFGLPQGSCIGLPLLSIYAGQLFDIVTQHLPTVHCYADDTKLYLAFSTRGSCHSIFGCCCSGGLYTRCTGVGDQRYAQDQRR